MGLLNILLGHDGLGEEGIEASLTAAGKEIVRPTPSPASPASPPDPETGRIAALDAERHARDRLRRHGYDYDSAADGHDKFLVRANDARGGSAEINRVAPACDTHVICSTAPTLITAPIDSLGPAKSLVRTCREYGVGLRLEPDGTVVVESNGRAWRSLVRAIEAHVDAVAQLIESRWDSNDA